MRLLLSLLLLAGVACQQPDHIQIEPKDAVLVGRKDQVQLYGKVMTGKFHHVKNRVKWSSQDEKVATVDEKGLVTPAGSGQTRITATWGKLTAEIPLEVLLVEGLRADVTSVVLSYDDGDPARPKVEPLDYRGRVLRGRNVFYAPRDTTICRVDGSGQFWPGNRGSTTVVASVEDKQVEISCTVK